MICKMGKIFEDTFYQRGCESESCSVVSDSLQTHGLYTGHEILHVRILEWVAFPSPEVLPNPGIEPESPALQEDSLPTELCK